MPPDYDSGGEVMRGLENSSEEEKLLINLMKQRASKSWMPKRYTFSLLVFTACCLAISYNMNLSIAIVSMVNKHGAVTNETLTTNLTSNFTQPEMKFDWNSQIESQALGAVYYGQMISFIPGGRMAELYGGKRMLLLCMLVSTVATVLSPLAAIWSPYAFIVNRVLVGIGTGPIIPIVFYMLSKWIPETERSLSAAVILSGYGVGSFLAIIVSGALCGSNFLHGWPLVFYVGGISGFVWFLICAYMMYETPDEHPNISDEEYSYIINNLGQTKQERISKIPWKDMIMSVPLWALAIGFFGQFWLLGFYSTVHALYMGAVLNLPIVKNGVLSCLPHLLRATCAILTSYPVDIVLKKKVVSVGFVRKGVTLTNSVVSCLAFLGITLVGRDVTATTLLFILGGALGEFVIFGVCMACVDIAPCLSGTVSGIVNILGVFPFFIIPVMVGYMTQYQNSIEKWQKVFYTSIAVVMSTTLIFILFGDLNPQPWGVKGGLKKRSKKEYVEIEGSTDGSTTSPKKIDDIVF